MGVLVLASLVISTDRFFFSYFRGLARPVVAEPSKAARVAQAVPGTAVAEERPARKDSIGMPTLKDRVEGEDAEVQPADVGVAVEDEDAEEERLDGDVATEQPEEEPGSGEPEQGSEEVPASRRQISMVDEPPDLDEDEAERLDEVVEEESAQEEEDVDEEETEGDAVEDEATAVEEEPAQSKLEPESDAEPAAEAEVALEPEPEAEPERRKPRRSRRSREALRTENAAVAAPEAEEPRQDLLFEDRLPGTTDLLADAVQLVLTNERASVSFLQRKLRIRFAEASALLDQMEQLGVIGPYDEGSQRPILMTMEEWRSRRA
jgi:hypothetical protein